MRPAHAVVARVRLGHQRELIALPVESSSVHDDPANTRAMSTHPLGQRVHNDVGSEVDRTLQDRRRERGIDDQWEAVVVRDLGHRFDVGDIAGRIR